MRNLVRNFVVIFALLWFCLYLNCRYFSSSLNGDVKDPEKRHHSDHKLKCYIFVMIMTSPKGSIKRKAMRDTWLIQRNFDGLSVEHRFVIGSKDLPDIKIKQLNSENNKHHDLLYLNNHIDSYNSLTLKLLKTFIWIHENVHAEFVMKVDDDTFVRLDKLLPSLKVYKSKGHIYWGFFRGNANVKKVGPWKEDKWFLSDHYLPYALGGGYIISSDIIGYISKNADWFTIYNSEDASLGVWLAPVKINRIHDVRFDTEYKSKGCSNDHVVSHKQEPGDMYSKNNELALHGRLCTKESESMMTYDYNWTEPPSRCCKRIPRNMIKFN